ncbi:MAG: GEVED domain-containing protein, partial [Pseudomonadota bacterium]
PFIKAGWPSQPQESTLLEVIDDTLLVVFRELNLAEGIDGEDNDSTIELVFLGAVNDNDGSTLDTIPEIIVFERGDSSPGAANSDVGVSLILADGGVTDEFFISRDDFVETGFEIDTQEIGDGQELGVVGLDMNEFSGAGYDPATDTVVGALFGSRGSGADIFGVFGTSSSPITLRDHGDAPDSYGTLLASGGPRHVLSNQVYIGTTPDFDLDGEPSALADAATDEVLADAFILPSPPSPLGPGDTYSVNVIIENISGATALLCGWIDFNNDGDFDNVDGTIGALNAERACVTVADGSISTGATPTQATLNFILPNDITEPPDSNFLSRFRITTDWTTSVDASPLGDASDGEIEDHRISSAGTLPVSVIGFESSALGSDLQVRWTTASETHNAGFHLWADYGRGLQRLTAEAISAQSGDAATSRAYEVILENVDIGGAVGLALSAIDYRGEEAFYGYFEAGRNFGSDQAIGNIDWSDIGRSARGRMEALPAMTQGVPEAVSVVFGQSGMADVSASALLAAGLNLDGIATDRIAVTLKSEAVAREITNSVITAQGVEVFGPNSSIRFWARTPDFPDALYLDHYHFQVSEDPTKVRLAEVATTGLGIFSDRFESAQSTAATTTSYWARDLYAVDRSYHFSSPLQ